MSETKLQWTNLKGDAGSADARSACQTGLLFPVVRFRTQRMLRLLLKGCSSPSFAAMEQPSVDPKKNIFSVTVWDGHVGGYRAWQSDPDASRTLVVGGGFDPYWQEAQQFKLTCKVSWMGT